jgi:uncharacterized protein
VIRAVIDTNVFFSSFFGGNPRKVIDLWKRGEFLLCLSGPILTEYLEVLERAFDEPERSEISSLLMQGFQSIFIAKPVQLKIVISDPDDVKFIECAVSLDAHWIVTGDRALLNLKQYGSIDIVRPAEFVQQFS